MVYDFTISDSQSGTFWYQPPLNAKKLPVLSTYQIFLTGIMPIPAFNEPMGFMEGL